MVYELPCKQHLLKIRTVAQTGENIQMKNRIFQTNSIVAVQIILILLDHGTSIISAAGSLPAGSARTPPVAFKCFGATVQ